jgi:hypothetical protein
VAAVVYPSGELLREARQAAGWSIAEAARQLKLRWGHRVPDVESLVRSWKRWETGTVPSRFYRPLLSDLLGLSDPNVALFGQATDEVPRVFSDQSAAATEIRTMAQRASAIDVLAVRGLGLLGLKHSLLRPALERGHASRPHVRVLLLRPGGEAARRRAAEIGEPADAFETGISLAEAQLRELCSKSRIKLELYEYDVLPVWRLVALDGTLFVSTFREDREGHESAVYKVVPTPEGSLHRGFCRLFEDLRQQARQVI